MRPLLGTDLFTRLLRCGTVLSSVSPNIVPGVGGLMLSPSPTEPPPRPTSPLRYVKQQDDSVPYSEILELRAITTSATCGYANGDPSKPRTADEGFDCRVDVSRGLWGFCPTTIISASDCGLAGVCEDSSSCSSGCGSLKGVLGITTFTCSELAYPYCSTVILDSGPDQTYSYIACGRIAAVQTLLASPTAASTTPTTTTAQSTSTSASNQNSIFSSATTTSAVGADFSTKTTISGTSPPTSSTTAHTPSSPSTANNTGAIIGGTIGGLVVICVTIFSVVYLFRRSTKQRRQGQHLAAPSDNYQYVQCSQAKVNDDSVNASTWSPPHVTKHQDSATHPVELGEDQVDEQWRKPIELPA